MDKQQERTQEKDEKNLQTPRPESAADMAADESRGGIPGMMTGAMATTERVGTGMVGGVATVATDLVHGIGTVGGEVVSVVRDTANTAIAGVGSVGETAVHTLTGLLADLVGGIREVGSTAVYGRERSGALGTSAERDVSMRAPDTRQTQHAQHAGR
jgi:hypothetical protein